MAVTTPGPDSTNTPGTAFLREVRKCESPYGDGKASSRIAEVLSKIEITPELLQKKIAY
jgi:UDP-N-acetylglucosamine 2-epimerase (non-hydrolysing)/GDP/UDP-N,N'-diacetylbacillosamine 2-epimerase (hydrolysing)